MTKRRRWIRRRLYIFVDDGTGKLVFHEYSTASGAQKAYARLRRLGQEDELPGHRVYPGIELLPEEELFFVPVLGVSLERGRKAKVGCFSLKEVRDREQTTKPVIPVLVVDEIPDHPLDFHLLRSIELEEALGLCGVALC